MMLYYKWKVEWASNLLIQSGLKRSSCNKIIWVTHTFLEYSFMNDNLNLTEYIVLARKYRPQKFEDLIGQEVLVQTLTNAIITNRTAHAYLLTGVRGYWQNNYCSFNSNEFKL